MSNYIWSRLADIDRDWPISHDFHISLILLEVFEEVFFGFPRRRSNFNMFEVCGSTTCRVTGLEPLKTAGGKMTLILFEQIV